MPNIFYNPLQLPEPIFCQHNLSDLTEINNNTVPNLIQDWRPYFSQQFIDLMSNLAIDIRWIQIFKYPRNQVGPIHVDGDGEITDATRLNFILNYPCHDTMSWYDILPGRQQLPVYNRPDLSQRLNHNFAYIKYSASDVTKIHSVTCAPQALVQNKIPHNIQVGDRPRITVSLLLFNRITGDLLSMNQSCAIFSDYLTDKV